MRDVLTRARTNMALTPGERALLKLIEGLLCAGIVAALPALAGALGHNGVHWSDVARTALAAGAVAVLLAKYAKAHGDPALGDALAQEAAGLSDAAAGDGSPASPVTAAVPAQTVTTPPATAP